MKKNKRPLWGMSNIVLALMIIGLALSFTGCATNGGGEKSEYVPANWVMEEALQCPIKSESQSNFLSTQPPAPGLLTSLIPRSADDKDGEAIRIFAEKSQAKELTWYLITAPERPEASYYLIYHDNFGRTDWRVRKYTGISEYIPAWSMKKMTNQPPPLETLENVSPAGGIKANSGNPQNDEDINAILSLEYYFTGDYEAQWYACTSPARPGVTYYYRDSTPPGIITITNIEIYRQE